MAEAKTPPAGMRAVTKKSALPIYAIGAVWLLWSLLFPLYSPAHYLFCLQADFDSLLPVHHNSHVLYIHHVHFHVRLNLL